MTFFNQNIKYVDAFAFLCLWMFFVLFQIAASNYFFPHWLQENQSPNWKLFYRFSGCHGRFQRETFLLDFFRRLHWNIRRHESFPRIMMSNNQRYRQSLTSVAEATKLQFELCSSVLKGNMEDEEREPAGIWCTRWFSSKWPTCSSLHRLPQQYSSTRWSWN